MKIIHLSPGLIEIPPKGWGAIEEVIWNYKLELEKFGHTVEIHNYFEFLKLVDNGYEYDILHIHVSDQCHELIERGLKYFFNIHDIHLYTNWKISKQYLDCLRAVKHSILSFSPSMFLIERMDQVKNKIIYVPHGVNKDTYKSNLNKDNSEIKLLCIAKNGTAVWKGYDNKGFIHSVEIAKKLNLPLTIVGDNTEFFSKNDYDFSYVNIIQRNVFKDELINEFYGKHHILLHMSKLESGQPCLVILEALSCELPVVSMSIDNYEIPGVEFVKNIDDGVKSVIKIIENYDKYKEMTILSSDKYRWRNSVGIINMHYSESMKKHNIIKFVPADDRGIPESVFNIYVQNDLLKVKLLESDKFEYDVLFKDSNQNELYRKSLVNNTWCGVFLNKNHYFISIKRKDWVVDYVVEYKI